MTDEEIEKAWACCKGDEVSCSDCDYGDLGSCQEQLAADTIAYITRLKAENAALVKEANENAALAMEQKLRADKLEESVKNIRKETAKEILQTLCDCMDCITDEDGNRGMFVFSENIFSLAKKYGVEVKE